MNTSASIARKKALLARVGKWLLVPGISVVLVLAAVPYVCPLNKNFFLQLKSDDNSANREATEGLGLEETILAVRSDLIATQNHLVDRQEAAMFDVETVDIELSFVVKQTSSLGVEASAPKFVVVSADSGYQAEQIQRIRLHLKIAEPPPVNTEIISNVSNSDAAIGLK